jgi:hypothetical protein
MLAMKCKLKTPRVERWLVSSRKVRVLNRFDEVCNLVNDDGDVISIVSGNIGPGPFSMLLNGAIPVDIDAETTISINSSTHALSIGTTTIESDQAAMWNPAPDWGKMKDAARPCLAHLLPPARELVDDLSRLVQSITGRSMEECVNATSRLAGLGSGLTPAGDDVLMGVLYAMWAWHPDLDMMRLIVDTAVPRTTSLSAAFLRAAKDGEATIHWHDLADGRPGALDRILAIGASSGRDAWAGFTAAGIHFST